MSLLNFFIIFHEKRGYWIILDSSGTYHVYFFQIKLHFTYFISFEYIKVF